MPVPYTFGTATTSIPLSNLDANFNTPVTIGNTTVGLGNTVTTIGNLTLTNATISTGNVTVTTGIFGAGSNTAPSITTTGDTNTGIYFPAADTIAFTEGGVESMRIDSSGMLGLGITPNQTSGIAMEFGGSADNNSINFLNSANLQGWITSNAYYNGTNWLRKYAGGGTCTAYTANDQGCHVWRYAGASTVGSTISWSEAMRIDASGNLGIAQTSPSGELHVGNTTAGTGDTIVYVQSPSTDRPSLRLWSGTTNKLELSVGSTAEINSVTTSVPMTFFTENTERMRISPAGNVFINSTNFPVVGTEKFGIAGGTNIACALTTTSSSNPTLFINNNENGSITFVRFSSGSGGDTRGNITFNGSVVVYGTTSDYRLKTVIAPVTNAGQRIDALEPIEYDWNNSGLRSRGFLAHKFAEVYPTSVSGEKDAVDEKGKPVYQGMQASTPEVMADLIAEIQSLRKRVAQLESK
jgi:hypothetical protein